MASLLHSLIQLKELKEAVRNRGRINLLVAGKTGVGKSILINAVFQGNFASTGQGGPATRNTRMIKKKGVPLYIFDTRGFEVDRFLESLEELEDLICRLRPIGRSE
jgi:predicted GTPase